MRKCTENMQWPGSHENCEKVNTGNGISVFEQCKKVR